MKPRTKYAKSGNVRIAYQVFGDGALDLVYVPGWISHVEHAWEEPGYARFLARLATFARVITFDKRGTGLSDHDSGLPTLEERMDDVRAVMDAVGSERAAILGTSEGGNMSALFAATYPERTVALVLFGIFAKRIWSADYPWAPKPAERERWFELIETEWGGTVDLSTLAPSRAGDEAFAEWWGAYLRLGASPGAALALGRSNTEIDIREVLTAIRVPTLVLHRRGDHDVKIEEARYIAARVPNAKLVELEGEDHLIFAGDVEAIIDEIEEFLTGARGSLEPQRVLATILFTDIVGSTSQAAKLGDRRWHDLLNLHDRTVRQELVRFRGREINTTGDGFVAAFDGPARAIRSALAIAAAVRQFGIDVRAGIHTGECEVSGTSLAGIALHIGARVAAIAGPGEVLVSHTVKDLVAGSGIVFANRGSHPLRGIPGEWTIFAATGAERAS